MVTVRVSRVLELGMVRINTTQTITLSHEITEWPVGLLKHSHKM